MPEEGGEAGPPSLGERSTTAAVMARAWVAGNSGRRLGQRQGVYRVRSTCRAPARRPMVRSLYFQFSRFPARSVAVAMAIPESKKTIRIYEGVDWCAVVPMA